MKKYILFKLSDSTWKIVIVCHGNEVCIWEIVIVFSLWENFLVTSFCQIIVDLMSVEMPETLKHCSLKVTI